MTASRRPTAHRRKSSGDAPTTVKFSRLFQPRNPQFWLLIVLNGLSTAISFILRTYELPAAVTLVLAGFAVANVVIGIRIAWRLMADKPGASTDAMPNA